MIVYRELATLERDLGVPAKTLYALSNSISAHYRQVLLPKKDGGFRQLSLPDAPLKALQRRIYQVLLAPMAPAPWATAYRFGGSPRVNAQCHLGKPMVVKLDILHFFDSIRYDSVKNAAFPQEIYAENLRILLAMLCYQGDRLPQGAPTSPAISNLVMKELDETLGPWCGQRGIAYTRYCDDLTFSGDFDPGALIPFVRRELKGRGFLLNDQKTRILPQGQRQTVTGLVVNQRLALPRQKRRELRQELHFIQTYGLESHLHRRGLDCSPRAYLASLLGQVSYGLSVDPGDQELQAYRDYLLNSLRHKAPLVEGSCQGERD